MSDDLQHVPPLYSTVVFRTIKLKSRYSSVCVWVFFPFILDIKVVGRTSRGHTGGRSHRIFHPPSFFLRCVL